jgi:hypothetical protein
MAFTFIANTACEKCREQILRGVISRHPTCADLAVRLFECSMCGFVKTTVVSLSPGKTHGQPAA